MKMKKIIFSTLSIILTVLLFNCCYSIDNEASTRHISFYNVPLVCGADSSIGCGSRIKPLFIESEKQKEIKESWVNREGTIVAFIWTDDIADEDLAEKLFKQLNIDGALITDDKKMAELRVEMNGTQQWYKGMAVDSLSLQEAETIASNTTKAVMEEGLITKEESSAIRPEIENYFKKELVKVRTFEELCKDQKTKWSEDSYQIYLNHIGAERAGKVKIFLSDLLDKKEKEKNCKKSCGKDENKKDCCTKK